MSIRKVLVVDDSPADLANIKGIVTRAGCMVFTATSGKQALQIARQERPDIIFMDIVMKDMDGYEATRLLTRDEQTKSIPVIFVTSKGQKADRVWARMQGGKDLVAKPYTEEQITAQLKAF